MAEVFVLTITGVYASITGLRLGRKGEGCSALRAAAWTKLKSVSGEKEKPSLLVCGNKHP